MLFSLQDIINWLVIYRYWVIFPITIVEGPAISVLAGFLVAHGVFNLYLTYLILVAGNLTGDVLYYLLGRWSRMSFLLKWGKYVGFTKDRLGRIEKNYEQHSGKTLIIGKISHTIGAVFLISAGVARMPIRDFCGLIFSYAAKIVNLSPNWILFWRSLPPNKILSELRWRYKRFSGNNSGSSLLCSGQTTKKIF